MPPSLAPADFRHLARRYGWDMSAEDAAAHPDRILLRTLDIGRWEDVLALESRLGHEAVRRLVEAAPTGGLSPRSRAFWHYRLGLVAPGASVPPPPRRPGL